MSHSWTTASAGPARAATSASRSTRATAGAPRSAARRWCSRPFGALPDPFQPGAAEHLLLRRAATGTSEFLAWWDKARRGRAPQRRTVSITLLGDDHANALMHWRFRNARPVSLHYSPLNAMDNALVIESIKIAFDRVDIG